MLQNRGWILPRRCAAALLFSFMTGGCIDGTMTFGAWFAEFQNDFVTLQRHYRSYDSVSLFYYGVTENGAVAAAGPAEHRGMIAWAKSRGIKVYATIGGTPPILPKGFAGENGERCVRDIVRLCEELGYDGFDIDFEGIRNDARADFSRFVADLGAALKRMNPPRLLSVTVQDFPSAEDEASMAFDYREIARHADHVRVMCYDYSWDKPGPIMPHEWFSQVLEFSLSRIPAGKFIAALPWYGRDWIPADGTHIDIVYGQRDVLTGVAGYLEILNAHNVKPVWDAEGGEYRFSYTQAGKEHTVWMPEHEKFLWMAEEVAKRGAAGIYVWHAAYPDPGNWEILDSRGGVSAPPLALEPLECASFGPDGMSVEYTSAKGGVLSGQNSVDACPAEQLSVSLRLPALVRFQVAVEEGTTRGGDGETHVSPIVNGTGDWEEYVFALQALQPADSSDSRRGDGRLTQADIKAWSVRIMPGQEDGAGRVRDVRFLLIR